MHNYVEERLTALHRSLTIYLVLALSRAKAKAWPGRPSRGCSGLSPAVWTSALWKSTPKTLFSRRRGIRRRRFGHKARFSADSGHTSVCYIHYTRITEKPCFPGDFCTAIHVDTPHDGIYKSAIPTAKWAKNRKKADFLATLAKMSALALGQRVRETGLEPARPCGHQAALNLTRLPVGHTALTLD
jgi:hypothetical protein